MSTEHLWSFSPLTCFYSFCFQLYKPDSFTSTSLYCWLLISFAGTRLKSLDQGPLCSLWAVERFLFCRWILNWRTQRLYYIPQHSLHCDLERKDSLKRDESRNKAIISKWMIKIYLIQPFNSSSFFAFTSSPAPCTTFYMMIRSGESGFLWLIDWCSLMHEEGLFTLWETVER